MACASDERRVSTGDVGADGSVLGPGSHLDPSATLADASYDPESSSDAGSPEVGQSSVARGEAGSSSSPHPWQLRGIGGGGAFFAPEISPFDDQMYVSTDMGTLFHSSDFGASWSGFDFRKIRGGSHAQVRFTSDPRILYAVAPGGDGGSAFISQDGGASFTRLSKELSGLTYIEVDPSHTDRLLVGSKADLQFSEDSGVSFRRVYSAADSGVGLVLGGAFWDGATIYVGTNDGVLLSTDDGATFVLQSVGGLASGQSIISFAGAKQGETTRFFALTSSGISSGESGCELSGRGLYRLDVGERSWTDLTSALPSGHAPVFVGMAIDDVSVAYVGGTDSRARAPAVAKTSDGGATWANVFRTTGNQNIVTGWAGSGGDKTWGYAGCAEGFAVSRRDANKVAITDLGFVHVTDDGGIHWRQAYVDPADQNPAGADTPRARGYRGNGAEVSSVWWLTWPDATTIFASLTDFTSLRSTDGGSYWTCDSRNGLTQNTTYQALIAPSGTLYAPTSPIHDMYMGYRLADAQLDSSGGTVMQSTDKGAHWTQVHDFGHPVVFIALDPNAPDTMYASVVHHAAGGVFRTANLSRGASSTWTQLPKPSRTEGHPYNIVVLNDGSLVATYSGRRASSFTESSGVFLLPPSATSWTDVSAPGMHYWVKDLLVDPNDASQSTWYVGVFEAWGVSAAQDSNGLYRTTNRGQSWERIWAGHNVESATIDPKNPARMFVTTESDGLWSTSDLNTAAPSFTADPDFPFLHPMRVFFNPYTEGEVWVANFGGGMHVRQRQ